MSAWFLEVLRSPASFPNAVIPLRLGRTLVGRDVGCDLRIPDPRVSSRHCLIEISGDHVEISDLHSTNGTFIDGVRVQRTGWLPGQKLSLGATELGLTWKPVAGEPGFHPVSLNESDFDFSIVSERGIPGEGGRTTESSEPLSAETLSRHLHVLQQSIRALTGAPSVPELLDRVMLLLFEAVHCDTGYILVMEHGNQEAVRTHLAYEGGRRKENLEERLYSRTLVSKALESKTGFIFDRDESGTMPEADQSSSIFQLHIKTALCCPIHSEGRVFGVIYLDGKKSGQKFTPDDLELVMHVAGIAGMAIENIELYRKLRSEVRIREHLRRFVSPNVAEKIIAERGGGDFHLISQRTPISVLFADIRGFTRISESLPPLTVARILNAFFSRMSEVVFRNGGTLDKFVGDSMMVLFNAPVLHPDHEMAAVKTAVEMRRHLREMLPEWKAQGLPEIHMGIGINSGEAVAGSIGTDERMEYTAIGDTVNTAARVCGIAKPDQILVTGSIYEKLPVEFKAAPLGPVQLKGKSQPVLLFEIVEDPG
jgi:adenylate cyclase